MRILPIISRLKTQCPLLLNRVEPAQSLQALSDDEISYELPMVFVYAGKETATENQLINATSQALYSRFHVVIAATNSTESLEPIEDIREQIRAAFDDWQPSANLAPVTFVEGDVIEISKRLIWWKETYETWGIQ